LLCSIKRVKRKMCRERASRWLQYNDRFARPLLAKLRKGGKIEVDRTWPRNCLPKSDFCPGKRTTRPQRCDRPCRTVPQGVTLCTV